MCVQHNFLRMYASLHLVLMSLAVVSGLPDMGNHLHRLVPQDWLQSLGLWSPSVGHSIIPVLTLLLMVSTPKVPRCITFLEVPVSEP
jgi:hypothetical protein